jgi:hypothetical protein
MLGERIREGLEAEVTAGRECLARERTLEFTEEVTAGQSWAARVQVRLEEEQAAGRRTAARRRLTR